MALVGGDFGNIQIVDPATGSLRLVTQAGFGLEFLDYFAVVEDVHSTCGRARPGKAQTAIGDVRADPGFQAAPGDRRRCRIPGGPIHTPGRLYRSPDRHGLDAFSGGRTARQIATCGSWNCTPTSLGEALTAASGPRSAVAVPPDPVGRAMVTALLDPARAREADVSVPFELWVIGRMTVSFARRGLA